MTKDEALKMAINAMIKPDNLSFLMAITTCQDALEQPTVAELNDEYLRDTYVEGLNQPAQEPVAWMNINEDAGFKQVAVFQEPTSKKSIPLYTHPHQWQGLTDDEMDKIFYESKVEKGIVFHRTLFKTAEQALKDKNT